MGAFDPVYNWNIVKETDYLKVGTSKIERDLRVQLVFKKEVPRPQCNRVIYRFYDYMGVVLGWRQSFPNVTPLHLSYKRFNPLKLMNTQYEDDVRCLNYIHLSENEKHAVYDAIEAYDAVFSEFCKFRGF